MKITINQNLTKKIIDWLAAEHDTDSDIRIGAELLLSVNHDSAMFNRIIRNPKRNVNFIKYKLEKIVNARIDGFTVNDIVALDKQITPEITAAMNSLPKPDPDLDEELPEPLPSTKGIRPDHESLPDNIKQLWTDNAERWKRIKETFETCKALIDPCDRYEYLKILKEAWYSYKRDMTAYDSFTATDDKQQNAQVLSAPALSSDEIKAVNNARSYISKNINKLLEARQHASDEPSDKAKTAYTNLLNKIQERVNTLLNLKAEIGDDVRQALIQGGVVLELTAKDEQEA